MDIPCTILINILCVFEIYHNKMFRKLKKKTKQTKPIVIEIRMLVIFWKCGIDQEKAFGCWNYLYQYCGC